MGLDDMWYVSVCVYKELYVIHTIKHFYLFHILKMYVYVFYTEHFDKTKLLI